MSIIFGGIVWYNISFKEKNERYIAYSRYFEGYNTEELLEVYHKSKYVAYLKMVHLLWTWRDRIEFDIDNY